MRTNLILAAGKGKRFSDAGYTVPKPLIPVDGVPMIVAAARALPQADKEVFVISQMQVDEYQFDAFLREHFPQAEIVIQTGELRGQAHSCLQAKDAIDPSSQLNVGACDVGMMYDREAFEKAITDSKTDALIWSFRNYPTMATHPTSYGWIETKPDGTVTNVKYKVPISDTPLKDHAVVGNFSYKTAKLCFDNIEQMIREERKSGPEFSLDECTNVLISNGLNIKVFEIDKFLCWGTPNELKTYEYWKEYFTLDHYSSI